MTINVIPKLKDKKDREQLLKRNKKKKQLNAMIMCQTCPKCSSRRQFISILCVMLLFLESEKRPVHAKRYKLT